MRSAVLCLLFAVSTACAGEYAVLASGARMYADRHEIDSSKVRLYQGTDFVELNAWVVKDFEDAPPAPAAPSAPAAPALAVPAPPVATAAQVKSAAELADAAADRYGLPRALVRSVMAAESGMVPGAV